MDDETTGEAVCPSMLEHKGAVGVYVKRQRERERERERKRRIKRRRVDRL